MSKPRKSFYFREHMHKGKVYVKALKKRGFRHIKNFNNKTLPKIDAIFLDHDINATGSGRRTEVYKAYEYDIPLFIYPHSARPNIMYDLWRPWPFVDCCFVISTGHKRVLRKVGYPCPIQMTGWTYCDIKSFKPVKPKGKIKVLFAPIHPIGNGYLHEMDRKLNLKAFRTLLQTPGIDLYVRYLGRIEENGLFFSPKARYQNGLPDGSTKEIKQADVVIGSYTFAYLAAALGKPLVMMGEEMTPHAGNHLWTAFSSQWNKYKEYMRYPFNLEAVIDQPEKALNMFEQTMQYQPTVERWKKKFIGQPFNSDRFVDLVEKYIDKHNRSRVCKLW